MASFVAKIISKKILGETIQNKFGKEVCERTYEIKDMIHRPGITDKTANIGSLF
jgi:hypothetical protein